MGVVKQRKGAKREQEDSNIAKKLLYNKELLIVAGVAAMRLAALRIKQKSPGCGKIHH